jgi:hypothetical protein
VCLLYLQIELQYGNIYYTLGGPNYAGRSQLRWAVPITLGGPNYAGRSQLRWAVPIWGQSIVLVLRCLLRKVTLARV